MGNSGIVPDKSRLFEQGRQLRQRQPMGKVDLRFMLKQRLQLRHLFLVRFAGDEDNRTKQDLRV